MKKTPTFACLVALLGTAAAQTPIKVLNAGFTDGTNPAATDWTSVNGGGTNSAPSNYAETVPNLGSRSFQMKSDGGNYIQQALTLTAADVAIDASSFGEWSVSFQRGYRRDAVRNGDHTLRVSLWNTTSGTELAGADLTIPDPGSTGTNSLAPANVVLSYDETDPALAGAGLALRVTSTSADLGANAWQRTAIVDDFAVVAGVIDPGIAVDPVPPFSNNGVADTYTITFSNPGATQALDVSGVTLTGLDADFFTVESFTASVAPGGSGSIEVGFTPAGSGTYQAELVIASDASGTPSITVPVTVEVIDPVLSVGSAAVDFGSLAANPGSQSAPLVLTNDGGAADLVVFDVQLVGGGNGFTVVSFPETIAAGQSANVTLGFDPGSDGGDFGDLLRIETNAAVNPVRLIPVKAVVAHTPSATPVTLVNGDFDAGGWTSGTGTSPQGWTSSLAATNTLGNYGQSAPATPNLTSIAAHLQAVGGFYQQSLTPNNPGLTAGAAGTLTVTLDAGYRNDAATLGPLLLRVGLWDETNAVEITGRDLALPDTGVLAGAAANQLAAMAVRMSYPTAAFSDEALALRITQISPTLGTNPWQATAIVDNVAVAIDGTWQPPADAFAAWAIAAGLDGTPGKEAGLTDDPDRDGRANLDEFAFAGVPLSGSSSGLVASVTADTNADSGKELILTLAVRAGASFGGNPSPAATVDGIVYVIQGSTDLVGFTATVEGPLATPVIPASFPATAPAGYEYVSFRLAGSNGLPGKGFLRAVATEE
jgi:hypothetical protein